MPDTILIVDDDRGVRYSLKRMFEEKGMQTLTARNGREALEMLRQGAMPDVALIDIVMPGLSGLDWRRNLTPSDRRDTCSTAAIEPCRCGGSEHDLPEMPGEGPAESVQFRCGSRQRAAMFFGGQAYSGQAHHDRGARLAMEPAESLAQRVGGSCPAVCAYCLVGLGLGLRGRN